MILAHREPYSSSKKNSSHIHRETPIEESMKYLHLRNYLINAKKIREAWDTSNGK